MANSRDQRAALHHRPDTRSYTARSFVPYYAQQISSAIVMLGAQGILKRITKMRGKSLLRASDEEGEDA